MSLSELAPTLEELGKAIKLFLSEQCENGGDHLVHKNCGGAIRKGFLNLFLVNPDGSLDPGLDGFGIGPKAVPYCEKCFPPDGFNYAYAVRFPIARGRRPEESEDFTFAWGTREIVSGNARLLLK